VEQEIVELEQAVEVEVQRVIKLRPEQALIVHQSEWHLLGIAYHTRNVLTNYVAMARSVAGGALNAQTPDIIITPSPEFRVMMFEFYALVSLARITLDNLRLFLRPLFKTNYGQLPKSVRQFLEGTTDCPVYQALAQQPVVEYLCDLRDCLVHFRTFATNTNLVAIGAHVDPQDVHELLVTNRWFEPMARAYFGRSGRSIEVNVLLPDIIFKRAEGQKKVALFTYDERINLVAQSLEFLRLTAACILLTYSLLIEPGKPTYAFSKQKGSPNMVGSWVSTTNEALPTLPHAQ